ncbi:MAG: hypothetical protein KJ069_07415, partial [Anaerolineae bacterium]|nr:hypothetical protein [Anaerolineae bacterium]
PIIVGQCYIVKRQFRQIVQANRQIGILTLCIWQAIPATVTAYDWPVFTGCCAIFRTAVTPGVQSIL